MVFKNKKIITIAIILIMGLVVSEILINWTGIIHYGFAAQKQAKERVLKERCSLYNLAFKGIVLIEKENIKTIEINLGELKDHDVKNAFIPFLFTHYIEKRDEDYILILKVSKEVLDNIEIGDSVMKDAKTSYLKTRRGQFLLVSENEREIIPK